ncbi:3-ketodihydrosphingosine reductase isoform X2 [Melanaphis sacchari]|uniref:3-ketodihydrosphingosine reductase isoform X2 n=1 Tax=Melanaphis sacchari TaxID=742174 RepID=UPI000DC13B62|nr:3-ketodihydrosphingosine reductase isoform X2 [Melanaphis sacchari]
MEHIMIAFISFGIIVLSFVLATIFKHKFIAKKKCLLGRHVIVTGGSSGIGKCIALEAAKIGANVTIVARNKNRLCSALDEIKEQCSGNNQRFNYLSVDLAGDYSIVEKTFNNAIEDMGPLYMFINCAGMAICGTLEESSTNDIMQMINTNLISTIQATKAIVNKMKQNGYGSIVITSSLASFCGIYGLSVYCATKFALRGFAEALSMETKNFGVKVTLALPPDTDTPGYTNESKNKPLETLLISETAKLFTPEEVGNKILQDALDGHFFSTVGLEGHMMTFACAGMAPNTSYLELICQVFGAGILRLITVYYQSIFDKIIKKCKSDRENIKNNKTL